jgi:FMN phosphatase YigB (HAD superfamily)
MIKNVIFDLGNVLIKADFSIFKDKLCANGVSKEIFMEVFARNSKLQTEFESGIIGKDEFISTCVRLFHGILSKETFIECFNGMFEEITEMKDFLNELARSKKYKLYVLSNTNPIHFEYATNKYDYINVIENVLLSYRLKCLKPDDSIYEKIIKENNIIPEETIFIDDLEKNCDVAEKFGIKTIHYTDHNIFLEKFKLLTVNF